MMRGKLLVSAAVVAVLNLASAIVGFWVYKVSGVEAQVLVQVPVALVVGVLLVMGWVVGFRRFNELTAGADFMTVLLLAFPIGAIVFTGVHFVIRGYLTSFGNIAPLWGLQFAENVLALPLAAALLQRISRH